MFAERIQSVFIVIVMEGVGELRTTRVTFMTSVFPSYPTHLLPPSPHQIWGSGEIQVYM